MGGLSEWKKWLPLIFLAAAACSSPATLPAPVAEIPAVVNIPKDLTIDVSQASSSPGTAANLKFSKMKSQAGAADLAQIIPIGPDLASTITEDVLLGLLSPFNTFDIPVSPRVTSFEGTFQEPDSFPTVFKFDFTDYDFDGDGAKDGFTGCTCPVGCQEGSCPREAPLADLRRVGYRIWVQKSSIEPFQPVMAGFFDRLPVKDDPNTPQDEENPGVGQFRVNVVEAEKDESGELAVDRFLIGVIYNHRDPQNDLNKSTQAFLLNDFVRGGVVLTDNKINALILQSGKTDPSGLNYLEKTVKSALEAFESDPLSGTQSAESERYIGRFRDDQNFWSGSFMRRMAGDDVDLPTTCARITTSSAVSPEICQDLGIDTTGEEFLRSTQASDTLLPLDFPPLPPF